MKKITAIITLLIMLLSVTGCSSVQDKPRRTHENTTTASGKPVKRVGVIKSIDSEKGNIIFIDAENGTQEICTYNNGTEFFSKSGVALTAEQIHAGDVTDIYYMDDTSIIKKVRVSEDDRVWENTRVTSFSVDEESMSVKIGRTLYHYTSGTLILSDGEQMDIRELNNSMDRLIVRGYDDTIVSIVVDKGHGYLTLTGDGLFVGGLINVGSILARKIEPGMLLTVTEGTYRVEVVNGEYRSEKYVTIERGKEYVLDFSDVPANVTETGNIRISVDVKDARLYIDGSAYNYSSVLTLKTGSHSIRVSAEGYEDYVKSIEIKTGYQTLDISMKEGSGEESTVPSESTTTAVEGETYVSSENDVTVKGPEGGLVYFDGTYKGVAPITFDMITGTHVISILYGTEINSYTVVLAEGGDDVEYDFTKK